MFDKMVKMKNKKGFTLIEMLIVIAIIAILVSIVIPVVSHSTVKSAAAANAANLRSIEGQLSTMRVENPLAFETLVDQFGNELSTTLEGFGITGTANEILTGLNKFLFELLGFESFIESGSDLGNYMKYKLYHNTADSNGTLTIPTNVTITIDNVPASKAVNAGNMKLPADVPMTVYISEDAIVATYEYGNNSYTRLDFAEVAETGDYTGATTGSGGVTEDKLLCEMDQHTYEKCTCIVCGKIDHQGDSSTSHDCSVCGLTGVFTEHNLYNGGDVVKCSKTSDGAACTHTEAKHDFVDKGGCNSGTCETCGKSKSDIHHN